MSIAAYVRVSTVGQNEDSQRREIKRWLAGNSIEGVSWYVDKSSGDNLNRPAFEKLQADIFMGNIKTVVVWRLDRLSRKIRDGLNVLCDWCDKHLRVVSVSQQIDFNGTTGKVIAAVLLGIGQMEQEARRERQAIGIDAAKARGVHLGRKAGSTKAKPEKAAKLKEKGLTNAEIAAALGVSPRTVSRYLE